MLKKFIQAKPTGTSTKSMLFIINETDILGKIEIESCREIVNFIEFKYRNKDEIKAITWFADNSYDDLNNLFNEAVTRM